MCGERSNFEKYKINYLIYHLCWVCFDIDELLATYIYIYTHTKRQLVSTFKRKLKKTHKGRKSFVWSLMHFVLFFKRRLHHMALLLTF